MKVRTTRKELIWALNQYKDYLMPKYLYKPMSPAVITQMEYDLQTFQSMLLNTEKNPVWSIPIKLMITSPGTFELSPDLSEVLFLDDV